MTHSNNGEPEAQFDESQVTAIEVGVADRQIVIAGPGAGKTEVVSALVSRLVGGKDVRAADGLMVISFSNAAVTAVDTRLRLQKVDPVPVQTLDSLASQIIRDLSQDDPGVLSFDKRIALAHELLSGAPWERLEATEHLIVDEVQDIVGIRAELLLRLLESLPDSAGFTLLGDPAQGIYDFQLRVDSKGQQPPSQMTSAMLLYLASKIGGVITHQLTGQYRAKSASALAAMQLRGSVLSGGELTLLADYTDNIARQGSMDEVAMQVSEWAGKSAFLVANNGQSLLVSDALAACGLDVEIRRSASQRVIAGWIAALLGDSSRRTIRRDELAELAAERTPWLDGYGLWRAIRSVAGGRGTEVDIERLALRLATRRTLAPDLIDSPDAPFVVSTVHRAKGLEFDNVVLVDFPDKPWFQTDVDDGEFYRTQFVAITRARELITRADGPDDRWLRKFWSGRWYLTGPKKFMTFGFEMRVDDLDHSEPFGLDPAAVQGFLADPGNRGSRIQFVLDDSKSTSSIPIYAASHDGFAVGQTSPEFGLELTRRIGSLDKRLARWPKLGGARLESVATACGPARNGPVGKRGLWLVPVVAGMLTLDWKEAGDAGY